jgi:hypothetical protein
MVRVSGVPYDVDVESTFKTVQEALEYHHNVVSMLETEINLVRARNDRLEYELWVANELLIKQNIELINFHNQQKAQNGKDTS